MTDHSEAAREPIADQLKFLASSEIRAAILRQLQDEPLIERDLRDALEAPRSTVHQNVEKLQQRDWLKATEDGYRTTWYGAAVLGEYDACTHNLSTAQELGPFLEHVPVDAVDLSVLHETTVTVSEPNRPNAALERICELFDEAESFSGFMPYVVPRWIELGHQNITKPGHTLDLVLSETAAEAIVRDHPQRMREAIESENATHWRYEGDLPYSLLFLGGRAVLTAFDDLGHPRAVVDSPETAALSWAESVYERYYEAADLITIEAVETAH
jgi:predicted transcriptional regulator